MTLNTIQGHFADYIRASFSSFNRFVLLLASVIALFYSFTWIGTICRIVIDGGSECILNFGFLSLFVHAAWQDRKKLAQFAPPDEDRLIGQALVISGVAAFPLVRDSVSFQAVAFAWISIGVILSQWGLKFFQTYPLKVFLLLVAIYPDLSFIAIRIFRFFTGENLLERMMAVSGAWGLQLIGQDAFSQADLVTLPSGSVWVGPGCSGFSMAFTLAGTSFILGLFMRLDWLKTLGLIAVGIAVALAFNVPRIMLLANAAVYWGEESFDFWHGAWGGQIFASIMFTAYYYIAMAIVDISAKKAD